MRSKGRMRVMRGDLRLNRKVFVMTINSSSGGTPVSSVTQSIERAAQLPLNDAAYLLWSQRYQLNWEDLPPVIGERDPYHSGGATFRRLKAAHPAAQDQDLQKAIDLAIKLDADCARFFVYSDPSLFVDAQRAVELARKTMQIFWSPLTNPRCTICVLR